MSPMATLRAVAGALLAVSSLPGCSQSNTSGRDPPTSETASGSAPFSAAPSSPAAESATIVACGGSDQPDCPLQSGMKGNSARAMKAGDHAQLEKAFRRIDQMAPPGYTDWSTIARDGLKAAESSDLDGCRRACKSCHDAYKAKYRGERRGAAIPPG